MKEFLFGVALMAAAAAAQAGGSASISCSNGNQNGSYPVLSVTYSAGGDAGAPGLFWLGAMSSDQTRGAALTISNTWSKYEGGLYPPNRRFDAGLPGVITLTVPVPPDSFGVYPTNTAHLVGFSVYAGHGVLTPQAQQQVASRRAYLNGVKPERVAAGKWRAEYDDDDQFKWSLAQKNMTDNGKYGAVLAVPFLDCAPLNGGGR